MILSFIYDNLKVYLPRVSGSGVAHLMTSSVMSDHSLNQAAVGMLDIINVFFWFSFYQIFIL
jgi:hypothetical protein